MEKSRSTIRRRAALLLTSLVIVFSACMLAACGKTSNNDAAPETEATSAAGFVWSATSDCTVCHTAEAKSTTDATMLAATHTKAGVKCTSCHTNATALKSAHDGVTLETKVPADLQMKKTTVDQATCLSSACHNTTLAELAKKTAGSTVLTDLKGKVVNPHVASTLTQAHVDAKMTCADCHSMHKAQDPMGFCVTCHHAKVFECHTCHE
ncbi:MAG: cytochrome c3 family protein [Coriobacteriia bacterium]|nr:cytochrome c3 family protein [Coriobacteriia bacterium]